MNARFVDVSHTVEHDMVTYPGLPSPRISDHLTREASRAHYAPGTEFHVGRIDMVANTGTYLDTPFHRYPDGDDLAGLGLGSLANLPAVCLAAPPEGPVGADILPDNGLGGRAVLVATGWDRHWRTPDYGADQHPFLAETAVEKLVTAGVALVGIDSVNIDDTRGNERPAHTHLLAAGTPIVEHLTGLTALVDAAFRFFAVPAKISGLGSFPVRAFALID